MSWKKWLEHHYPQLLLAVLAFAFVTRIYQVQEPQRYIFDEVYHAVTAKLVAHNDPRAFEWWNPAPEPDTSVDWLHPPLAKYTQALSILLLGENTLGWRFSSVIFGVLVTFITAKLAEELFADKKIALLAAILVSLDGLLLVQSRIAMNDIHVTFFILLSLFWYVKFWRERAGEWGRVNIYALATGISLGLAVSSKWSGAFAIAIVGLFEAFYFSEKIIGAARKWLSMKKISTKKAELQEIIFSGIRSLCGFLVLPAILYIVGYGLMFYQGKSLICWQEQYEQGVCYQETFRLGDTIIYEGFVSHFWALHKQIWWYQTNLDATHDYQSRPWQWALNIRPVWYHVDYQENQRADIYAHGNTFLFWFGLLAVAASAAYALMLILRRNQKKTLNPLKFVMMYLLISYFAVWLPWQLSPRIMFFYHYTPAVPLLSIILAFWLTKLLQAKTRLQPMAKILALIIIASIGLYFYLWYPHWTGRLVDLEKKDAVYFRFEEWK